MRIKFKFVVNVDQGYHSSERPKRNGNIVYGQSSYGVRFKCKAKSILLKR